MTLQAIIRIITENCLLISNIIFSFKFHRDTIYGFFMMYLLSFAPSIGHHQYTIIRLFNSITTMLNIPCSFFWGRKN